MWAGVLFGLSSIPGSDIPETSVPSADKWVHISLYAVLGLLCFRAIRGSFAMSPRRVLVAAVALVLLYGISDELHQKWVPLRSPDPMDAAADLVGGILGASFMLLLSQERSRRRGPARPARPARTEGEGRGR